MQLSNRLKAVCGMVSQNSRLADVGTDHGYIPINLVLQKTVPSAVAMDIRKGPLLRAKANIKQYGLEPYIETRLCDGVQALRQNEADTVVIAGMGGILVQKILSEGASVLRDVKEFVLQPQSELYQVRLYLEENGYRIEKEHMLKEDGKFYTIIKAVHGTMKKQTETEGRYGRYLLDKKEPVLREYLENENRKIEKIIDNLREQNSEAAKKRILELEHEMFCIQEALSFYIL